MPADDLQLLREEIAGLRRVLKGMGQMGRVMEVKKGRIRVKYGKADGGDENGDDTGVWIRVDHGGAQSESRAWAVGETVATWAVGGNPEHCVVHPAGFNDKHPRDGNSTDTNGTRRWRKPPEAENGQGSGSGDQGSGTGNGAGGQGGAGSGGSSSGSYGNDDKNEAPQWKDDEDDHQEVNTNEKRSHKFGKYEYEATKDGATLKYDKTFVRNNKGKIEIGEGDDVHFVYESGKLQVKCEITDKNGKKFAVQGTKTSDGKPLVSDFAND